MTDNILPFRKPAPFIERVIADVRDACAADKSPTERRVAEAAEWLKDWQPPTGAGINNPHLINVRLAFTAIVGKRARAVAENLSDEDLQTHLESMTDSAEYFAALSSLCALASEAILEAREGLATSEK
ncbi:hypothetical protein [Methylocystis echinoides]|uniref:Uncharacterized protein n=1 Tax=Methylocystis echinoides TaxID=29468 RepID=A0A9W6LSY0_9HYPH|nr:hypothetical protein [Methylocystis echinoides]GLI93952.1 hypothetical protein LMG27198_29440 [Methylocystis echinoides]